MSPLRRALPLALSLALCGAGRSAGAQTASDDAAALYDRGFDLREHHRDAEALEVFERVFELTHEPRAEAQVALAAGQIGRLVDAEMHLVNALSNGRDRWIRHNRASLEAALERLRAHLGALVVECGTPGAELWIAGARVGGFPIARPVRAVAGTVTYEVRASGFVTETRTVQVPREPVLIERVTLRPAPVATTPPPAAPLEPPPAVPPAVPLAVTPPPVTPPPVIAPVVLAPPPPRRGTRTTQRALAWAGLGASVALLGGGVVALALRESAADRYNNLPCAGEELPVSAEPSQPCRDERSTAGTMQSVGIAGVAIGGALAVASVVALITARDDHERTPTASLRCGGGPGLAGLSCGGTF